MTPDVLLKFAELFLHESDLVNLQILNLTAKMILVTQDIFILPFLAISFKECKPVSEKWRSDQ